MTNFTDYELNTIDKSWRYYHKTLKIDRNYIKQIRVCIYLRKSTEDVKDNSLKLQLDEIKKFIKLINESYKNQFIFYFEETDVFKEDNVSGMQGRLRPEFDRMLSIIENNPGFYGVCFVYKMDRFSRKLEDTLKYITLLKSFKCVLKALDFNDNGDPTSDLLKNILGVVAQYHAQNSALTSIKGTLKKVEEHKTVGLLPIGLISEKTKLGNFNHKGSSNIVIDEDKAIIVKLIFQLFKDGYSVKEIEKYLMEKGYTKVDGTHLKYQQIYYILRNKRYNGTYIYADPNRKRYYKYDNGVTKPEYHEYKNAIPKIIDDDLFEKVQDILNSKNKTHQLSSEHSDYLLSGLIICNCCGKTLHGWSRPKYRGKVYYDYVCTTHKTNKELCPTKRINKLYLEKIIIKMIVLLSNKIMIECENILDKVLKVKLNKIVKEIENMNKDINFKKIKINKLIDRLIIDNTYTKIYDEKIKELESEIINLESNLNKLKIFYKTSEEELKKKFNNLIINEDMLINNITLTKVLITLIFEKIILSNEEIKFKFF